MCAPWSVNLVRHGDSQTVVQYAFLAISSAFLAFALWSDSAMMPAEVYGAWVVSYPAENWAISIFVASITYLMGISINGSNRFSPFLRLAGASWHAITLSAFSVGASSAQYGDFFALATGVFAMVHVWFVSLNLSDAARAIMRSGQDGRA